MRKLLLALLAIVLVAGCTQGGFNSVPEIKAFLTENPNATLTSSLYTPLLMKNVISEFSKDCPSLDETKNYYRVDLKDSGTERSAVVWIDDTTNKAICVVSKAVEMPTTTSTSETTTTSSTTIASSTTTSTAAPTTTTTAQTTTTTANQTNQTNMTTTTAPQNATTTTTSSSTTTTTLPQFPDLTGSAVVYRYTSESDWRNAIGTNITITNTGTLKSNLTYVQAYIANASDNTNIFGFGTSVNELAVGNSTILTFHPLYNVNWTYYKIKVVIDWYNNNTEISKSNNNVSSDNFPIPFPG